MATIAEAAVALADAVARLAPREAALQAQPDHWLSSARASINERDAHIQSWALSAQATLDGHGTHLETLLPQGEDDRLSTSHARLHALHAFAPVLGAAEVLRKLVGGVAPALLASEISVAHVVGKEGSARFVLRALGMRCDGFANAEAMAQHLVKAVSWTEGVLQGRRLFRLRSYQRSDEVEVLANTPEDAVVLWWARCLLEKRGEPTREPASIQEVLPLRPLLTIPKVRRLRALMAGDTPLE